MFFLEVNFSVSNIFFEMFCIRSFVLNKFFMYKYLVYKGFFGSFLLGIEEVEGSWVF